MYFNLVLMHWTNVLVKPPMPWVHRMKMTLSRVRLNSLSLTAWLCLVLLSVGSYAGERWVYLGDLHIPTTRATGKLSINLESLRSRDHHYEIWERIVFEADAAQPSAAPPGDDQPERLTLWAILCKRGVMAKVTERVAGSFDPRAESLRFYAPAPASSGAAVIETTCAEVRRGMSENGSVPANGTNREDRSTAPPELDYPPLIINDADFDEDVE
jgi:hypothetical protein